MRATKLIVLCLVLIGSLVFARIGGTFATWSDSEIMYDNTIITGSVDLLVAKCAGDWATPGAFKDDEPWGEGLAPCFNFSVASGNFTCYSLLWNAGSIDAVAYLHIKNVSDVNALSSHTIMRIWYDDDGNHNTSLVPVASDTIANLDCYDIKLGGLPAEEVHQLKLEVEFPVGCPGDRLSFDILFQLASNGFADSEISQNYFAVPM